jgi:hypothetical protein
MKVILISAKAQHGKDFTARIMKVYLKSKGKRVLITHYADILKWMASNLFEWDGEKNKAGRSLLQYVGTDVVRKKNPNYFTDFMVNLLKMFDGEWDYVIIPDVRFPNEIECMKDLGGVAVRVVRDGFQNSLTAEQASHPSEVALDNYDFDFVLHNSGDANYSKVVISFCDGILSATDEVCEDRKPKYDYLYGYYSYSTPKPWSAASKQ